MVDKFTFDNGIRLICEQVPHSETVSIGLWQDIGSSYERMSNNGYTHFIEHMLFKGAGGLSAFEMARRIDSVGGIMNAFTTRERTCFYANVVSKHALMVLDLLKTMYYESEFDPLEIEREKQVVIQEIKMYEDSPDELVHDKFIEGLWPNHPIGHPIVGSQENILSLNQRKLLSFFDNNYPTNRLVVAVAGHFDLSELKEAVSAAQARVATTKLLTQRKLTLPKFQNNLFKKKLEQVHVVIGMPGLAKGDPRRYALYLLNLIIGGSMSSRLYQRIREEEGICYSIYSFTSLFMQNGFFGIYCATSIQFLKKVFQLIKDEIDRISEKGIDQEELLLSKEQMKGNIILGKESIEARMNRLAVQELSFGRHYSLEEIIQLIDSVTLQDMQDMIELVFKSGKYSLCTLGPARHVALAEKYFPWK